MIFQQGGSAGDVLMGLSKPSPLPSKDGEILLGRRIAGYQVLNMHQGILLGARRSPGWDDDLSIDHIEIDEPG